MTENETVMCSKNCPAFKMDEKGWTRYGASAICLAGRLGKKKIGVIPFILAKNSNTPDTSYANLIPCVNPEERP